MLHVKYTRCRNVHWFIGGGGFAPATERSWSAKSKPARCHSSADKKFRGAEAAMTQNQGFCGSPWADRNDWVCQLLGRRCFERHERQWMLGLIPTTGLEMVASFFLSTSHLQ